MPRFDSVFHCIAKLLFVALLALSLPFDSFAKDSKKTIKKSSHKSSSHPKILAKVSQRSLAKTKKNSKKQPIKEVVEAKPEVLSQPEKSVSINAAMLRHKSATRPITQKLWQGISDNDLEFLKKISVALQHNNYSEALKYAAELKAKEESETVKIETDVIKVKPGFADAVVDIILWNKFSSISDVKKISFSDISRFVNDNPFYPNISDIRRNAEKVAVANKISYQSGEQYFKSNPARSTESKLYLLQSKIAFLHRFKGSEEKKMALQKEVTALISNIWVKENFSAEEESAFLSKYQNQLNSVDHVNRIDRLLWDGRISEAKRIMNFVDEDHQRLFTAVIEIQDAPRYIDNIILSVPRRLRANEGLSYRRAIWYKGKDKKDELLDLIMDLPSKTEHPEKWWGLRHLYGREMLKKKNYKVAYLLVAKNGLATTDSDFWEAEWISGWIALRFLDKPKEAYEHFDNLYKNVSQPVTLARAAYWLGMASQAMGDRNKAIEWYKVAAKYPLFFYGQLGINKHRALDSINAQYDIILPKDPDIMVSDMKTISASKMVQIAYLLALTGDKKNATKIFDYSIENAATDGQIAVIMKIVNELDDRQMDVRVSRTAAKKNVFFIKDKFQIVKEVPNDEYAPLVHAIVKQESGFAPLAVSNVGAIGFMQLMPATAKLVARDMGVRYDKDKLSTDIKYNVSLGTFYIKKMIDRFNGSEMLAIASYNAGPNAAQRWINEFYDPRKEKDLDKVVDWIELITYSETRNYVQRITENLIVYKYLMSRSNYDAVQ